MTGEKKYNVVNMVKKDTRKKITNPKTGRKVFATGSVGKRIKKKSTKIVAKKKNTTKKKPMYQEAKLSDLIYKKKRNLYVVRLRDFNKVDNFDEVELTKCK